MSLAWEAPGPVARAFQEADDPVRALMGPVGSAKTTTGLMEMPLRSYRMRPGPDGRRRARYGVVRRFYADLWKTTLTSWWKWFPPSAGQWAGAKNGPATHNLVLRHPADGGLIDLEVQFRAFGDQRIEDALRGWEISGAFVDEMDLLDDDGEAIPFLYSRTGRYPAKAELTWRGVWGALNAPDLDSWFYDHFVERPREGYRLFVQPSGLSPQAENLSNLPPAYYEQQLAMMPDWRSRRLVRNEFGMSRDGKVVYPEFHHQRHMSPVPLAVLDRPVVVGMDAGGTPAAVLLQRAPNGQWRVLAELVTDPETVTGPRRFGAMLAELLHERCKGLHVRGLADPSAAYGADREAGEGSWIELVAQEAGIRIAPAPTQDPTLREEALRKPLVATIDGSAPGIVFDPSCRGLRRALAKDYAFRRRPGLAARFEEKPAKNEASHRVEALQYGLLDGGAFHEVAGRQRARAMGGQPAMAQIEFNPFA